MDESVLTETGVAAAQQVGQALQELHFDAIYSSPLKRARQTAETLLQELSKPPAITFSEQLMEIDLPLWQGLRREEVMAQSPEDYECWRNQPAQFSMELTDEATGESRQHFPVLALFEQARGFWRDCLRQQAGKTVLIVGHNGILRSLISTAVGMGPENYQVIRQSNCNINVLNFSGGLGDPVQMESLNLTGHLGETLPDRRSKKGCRLLLVRHGETEWNRMSRFQGQIDIPLNENGKTQAQKAAEFLRSTEIHFAVTSPLSRPKETAQSILQHHSDVELAEEAELKEIGHGLWEGKLEAEIQAEYAQELADWKRAPETVQMPEGENLQQVWDRGVAAWENIVRNAPNEQTGLVVAHDAVNKCILCHVLGLQPKDIWAVKQGNGAVTVVDYPNGLAGKPVVQALNITTHFGSGVLDSTAAGAL